MSNDKTEAELSRDYQGEIWNFKSWNNASATIHNPIEMIDLSQCGFNSTVGCRKW